jgi:hypothetical protein
VPDVAGIVRDLERLLGAAQASPAGAGDASAENLDFSKPA